jgi:hypothetical protein
VGNQEGIDSESCARARNRIGARPDICEKLSPLAKFPGAIAAVPRPRPCPDLRPKPNLLEDC